jgi:hypothetical protein
MSNDNFLLKQKKKIRFSPWWCILFIYAFVKKGAMFIGIVPRVGCDRIILQDICNGMNFCAMEKALCQDMR